MTMEEKFSKANTLKLDLIEDAIFSLGNRVELLEKESEYRCKSPSSNPNGKFIRFDDWILAKEGIISVSISTHDEKHVVIWYDKDDSSYNQFFDSKEEAEQEFQRIFDELNS